MAKPITYNDLLRQARLHLIRETGNLLGDRDFEDFNYDALTRQLCGEEHGFAWFLDVYEAHLVRFQAGATLADILAERAAPCA